jgi:hypothetical protein
MWPQDPYSRSSGLWITPLPLSEGENCDLLLVESGKDGYIIYKIVKTSRVQLAHACNPGYLGDLKFEASLGKQFKKPHLLKW